MSIYIQKYTYIILHLLKVLNIIIYSPKLWNEKFSLSYNPPVFGFSYRILVFVLYNAIAGHLSMLTQSIPLTLICGPTLVGWLTPTWLLCYPCKIVSISCKHVWAHSHLVCTCLVFDVWKRLSNCASKFCYIKTITAVS